MSQKLNILLVDDDEDDFFIAKTLFSEFSFFTYSLDWAKSFQEAEKIIKEKHHDVYLFDYRLGKDTGLDLLRILRKKGQDLPAIMLTGKSDQVADSQAVQLGAYDYLEKSSLTSDTLERSIRYALKHSETLAALRQSEIKYRTVVEHSKEIIFIANEDFNIVHASRSAEGYLGYTREEIYAMQSQLLFDDPLEMVKLQEVMEDKMSISDYALTLKTKDGEKKEGLLSCIVEMDENERFFIHGIFSDQTQRIKAEKAMLHSQKLQSTARLMQVLAHEVRNPLMNIQLSLGSLKDNVCKDDEAILDIIKRNAGRIDELISEVLNAASEKEVIMKPTSLSLVVENALSQVRDRAVMQKVEILTELNKTPKISINAEQVSTAIVNILVNAIEAMEEVASPVIQIKSILKEDKIILTIQDNGVGMDKELLSKLFEPFYTAKTNGVGLGLATTLGIIKAHNARIDVSSEPGKGSTFLIEFTV